MEYHVKQKEFKPIELSMKFENEEELKGFRDLLANANVKETPGYSELYKSLDKLVKKEE